MSEKNPNLLKKKKMKKKKKEQSGNVWTRSETIGKSKKEEIKTLKPTSRTNLNQREDSLLLQNENSFNSFPFHYHRTSSSRLSLSNSEFVFQNHQSLL